MERPDFYTYFDGIAKAVAARSSCPRAQCGAVIVDWNSKAILSTGYNGAPRGQAHCLDAGCILEGDGTDAEHCIGAVHAELNAVLNAARTGRGLENAVLFLSSSDGRPPCPRCEIAMRQAGLTRWYTNMASDTAFFTERVQS